MIKRIPLTILACLLIVLLMTSMTNNIPTPAVVTRLYNTIATISKANSAAQARDYKDIIIHCFHGIEDGKSGIPVPNDFLSWSNDTTKILTAKNYANAIEKLCYEQKIIRLSNFSIGKSHYLTEPEIRKRKYKPGIYIETIVTKTFTDNRISQTYQDTLIVEEEEITLLANSSYTRDRIEDVKTLRALAAHYYTQKSYYRAYEIYQKIIRIDPSNANAYYRLGIMTYYQKGCNFPKKRLARKKGIEYIEKSQDLGFDAAATLYYFTHSQSI